MGRLNPRRIALLAALAVLPAAWLGACAPDVPWGTHVYCQKVVGVGTSCPAPNGAVYGWFGANEAVFPGSATTARVCARTDIYRFSDNARVRSVRDCGISSVTVITPLGYEDRERFFMVATVENGSNNPHTIIGRAYGHLYGRL
jgi:hypothetical protein